MQQQDRRFRRVARFAVEDINAVYADRFVANTAPRRCLRHSGGDRGNGAADRRDGRRDLAAAHAVRGAIDEALRCKQEGKRQTIVFNLCGHGYLDLSAYEAYLAGKLVDYEYPTEKVEEALRHLPQVNA